MRDEGMVDAPLRDLLAACQQAGVEFIRLDALARRTARQRAAIPSAIK